MASKAAEKLKCGNLYDLCLDIPLGDRVWFGFFDCAYRFALPVLCYYFFVVTTPISFFVFTFKYNLLHYGTAFGIFLTSFYFVLPFLLVIVELGN